MGNSAPTFADVTGKMDVGTTSWNLQGIVDLMKPPRIMKGDLGMDKLLKQFLWIALILFLAQQGRDFYQEEQLNKGKAISSFLAYYHDIDVTPSEARWFVPVVTTYNITLEELNILPAYAPIKRSK